MRPQCAADSSPHRSPHTCQGNIWRQGFKEVQKIEFQICSPTETQSRLLSSANGHGSVWAVVTNMPSVTLHCTPSSSEYQDTLKKRVSRKLNGESFLKIVVEDGYTDNEAAGALRSPFTVLDGSRLFLSVKLAGMGDSFDMVQYTWVLRTARGDLARELASRVLQWAKDEHHNDILEIVLELRLVNAAVLFTKPLQWQCVVLMDYRCPGAILFRISGNPLIYTVTCDMLHAGGDAWQNHAAKSMWDAASSTSTSSNNISCTGTCARLVRRSSEINRWYLAGYSCSLLWPIKTRALAM